MTLVRGECSCLKAYLFAVLLLPQLAMAQTRGPVTIQRSGNSIVIANAYLERELTLEGSCVRTASFTNKLSHQTYSITGHEFEIQLIDDQMRSVNPLILTTRDFALVSHNIDEEPDGGRKVSFHLEGRKRSLDFQVIVSYELKPEDYYTRQWIEVKPSVKHPRDEIFFIHYLAVFTGSWPSVTNFDLGGLGQPLFGQDVFMGLEYPSGINEANGKDVTLGSYVGLELQEEGFASASAVLGVTLPHRVHHAFMTYINRIRRLPARPYIEYNNFYDVPGTKMNTQNTLERVAELEAHLLKPYSLHLDTFTLDDSWDDPGTLWGIDEKRFPNGFGDAETALHKIHSNLGLWLSPMGGYGPEKDFPLIDHRERVAVGQRMGLEINANTKYFCMSGEVYGRYLQRVTVDMISRYNANYFKFDGIPLACNQTVPGHPDGIYSREAAVRNTIALAKAISTANSSTFIDLATGPWLSPWWLAYGESVDYGGEDYSHSNIASPSPRQSAISYRDSVAYQDIKVTRAQFPISSLTSTGIVKERDLLKGKEENLDDWKDEVINYLVAGFMFADIMLSPTGHSHELLTSEEWAALGRSLQYFVRNGHPLVENSTWVLGDPARGEPYGFVHYSDEKTIILLRNPSVRSATVSLKLNEENGFEPAQGDFWADVVYPFRESLPGTLTYGSALEVTLDGYEQRVFELSPVRNDVARIEGIRFSRVSSRDTDVSYTVYGAASSEVIVPLSSSLYLQAEVDGKKTNLEPAANKDQRQMRLEFGRRTKGESQASCQSSPIRTDGNRSSVQLLDISLSCVIPSDFQHSEVAVLLESAETIGEVEGGVVLDGKPAPLALQTSKRWYWGAATVPRGHHAVEFNLRFLSGLSSSVQVSGWLRGRRLLESRKLRLVPQRRTRLQPAQEDLLPLTTQVERKTYPLFEQRID